MTIGVRGEKEVKLSEEIGESQERENHKFLLYNNAHVKLKKVRNDRNVVSTRIHLRVNPLRKGSSR